MPGSIAQKMRINKGDTLLTLHAPPGFEKDMSGLPPGVTITESGKEFNQIHWFIKNRAQLEKELSKVLRMVKEGVMVWAYYPKGTSKVQTDLTRDKGWDCLWAEDDKLSWVNLVSFNDTWSAFGFRAKTAADRKKEAKPKPEREIFKWADPVGKVVILPDDLATALKKSKKVNDFFASLSFTNKKEYVEWIVTAKREETRSDRIKGSVERLVRGWKNPRNI